MNKVILMGRLVKDPEVRYTGADATAIARYTLAVDRKFKKDGEQTADFISCVAFGKAGEFTEKYLKRGTKIVIEGRIQTGSYEKDGVKHYTTDVVIESQEFAESKKTDSADSTPTPTASSVGDGFMNIPDNVGEELPFA